MSVSGNPSIAGYVARGANAISDATWYLADNGGGIAVSSVLGAIGGYLTGTGAQIGLFQGFAQGAVYSVILRPSARYIEAHQGHGPEQFHENTCVLFYTAGVIANYIAPIIITGRVGVPALEAVSSRLPSSISWVFAPGRKAVYSYTRGLFINFMPSIAQHTISFFRTADKECKKR